MKEEKLNPRKKLLEALKFLSKAPYRYKDLYNKKRVDIRCLKLLKFCKEEGVNPLFVLGLDGEPSFEKLIPASELEKLLSKELRKRLGEDEFKKLKEEISSLKSPKELKTLTKRYNLSDFEFLVAFRLWRK